MQARLAAFVAGMLLTAPAAARAQYYNDLALRTNGSVVRAGDTLKVELIALADFTVPFSAQVSYRYNETITVRDEDGHESQAVRERVLTRAPTPVIDAIARLGSVLLDDTFSFGHGSRTGRYSVEVAILTGAAGRRAATIGTCVTFVDPEATPEERSRQLEGCSLALHGVARVTGPGWITFEGIFPSEGRYSLVLVRDNRALSLVEYGGVPIGPRLLDLTSPALASLAGQTIDIVLHNHELARSTTLARLTVPDGR